MTFLILGILGGLFHIAGSQVRSFEHSAAQDILSKLQGDRKTVSVRTEVGPEALWGDVFAVKIGAAHFTTEELPLYTEPKRSHEGLVRNLTLDLRDFALGGLRIDRLSAEIPNCRFDFPLAARHRQIRLSQSGHGQGEVTILEHDLATFILAKFHEIKRVTVKIDRDKVFVEGNGTFLIFNTDFSVIAKLESPSGDSLILTHARILINGQVADEETRKALLDTLNPVVDLNKDLNLHGAIKIDRLTLREGILKVEGPTIIPDLPTPISIRRFDKTTDRSTIEEGDQKTGFRTS